MLMKCSYVSWHEFFTTGYNSYQTQMINRNKHRDSKVVWDPFHWFESSTVGSQMFIVSIHSHYAVDQGKHISNGQLSDISLLMSWSVGYNVDNKQDLMLWGLLFYGLNTCGSDWFVRHPHNTILTRSTFIFFTRRWEDLWYFMCTFFLMVTCFTIIINRRTC